MGVIWRPRRGTRRWALLLAGIVLPAALALGQGCGSAPNGTAIVLRWIGEDPQELFDAGKLYTQRTVFAWDFSSPEEVAVWQATGIDELRPKRRALLLRSSRPNLELLRSADFAAEEVTAIEVRVQGLIGGRMVLQWSGADQPLGPERRIVLRSPNTDIHAVQCFRFNLVGHSGWQGRIRHVRLRIASPPLHPVSLYGIRGLSETLQPEWLTDAAARPWKLDLDAEVRNVLLALPGRDFRRQLEVPVEGRLRLGWGMPGESLVPVHFRVVLGRPGAPPQTLYEAASEPGTPGTAGWHDVEIDLRPWQGERVELLLSVSAAGPLDPRRGLPVWANPEVLGRVRSSPPVNIVLISVDTLRADRLSLNGYSRPTSPHLDAWAGRRGVIFRTVVSSAPWTLPAHVSLLTGLDAVHHGVNHSVPAPPSLTTLAELLRRSGYQTLAITGGGFLRPEMGLSQGFDVYRYWGNRSQSEAELSSGIERSLTWIDHQGDRPFFLFFHTYEVHSPYRSRQPYLSRLSGRKDPDRSLSIAEESLDSAPGAPGSHVLKIVGGRLPEGAVTTQDEIIRIASDLYDSGVAYADAELGRLLERLEQPDLAGRTVVVFTSDHGEMFGEHALVSHTSLYDPNLLVPLIVVPASRRAAVREIGDQVRQIDVLPTILDLAGIAVPAGIDGISLAPLLAGDRSRLPREAWSYAPNTNRGLSVRIQDRAKYIFNNTAWMPFAGREELYRIDRDPGELNDMAASATERSALRRRSHQLLESLSPGLRVHFESSGPAELRGTLSGEAIREERVKSWNLACSCLELEREGSARFTVLPGQGFTVQLESVEGEELRVEVGTGERGPGLITAFRLRDLRGPESLVLQGGRWRRIAGNGEGAAARVSVWWHHAAPVRPPPSVSNELLQQDLRALGYLK